MSPTLKTSLTFLLFKMAVLVISLAMNPIEKIEDANREQYATWC